MQNFYQPIIPTPAAPYYYYYYPPPPPPPPSGAQYLPQYPVWYTVPNYSQPLIPTRGRGGHFKRRWYNNNRSTLQIIRCETCDREYKSNETYQLHLQAHIKCDYCEFTALPKLVREHSIVHTLPDFLKFTTPEDTMKWISERKKNYPTMANIAKKKLQQNEKQNRKQILDTPLYRYVNQLIGNSENRGRGRGKRGRYNCSRGKWKHAYNNRYGRQIDARNNEQIRSFKRPMDNTSEPYQPKRKKKWLTKNDVHIKVKPTLLEKLLASEIRHEHNIILQCVHYIVSNNFFEKASTAADVTDKDRSNDSTVTVHD